MLKLFAIGFDNGINVKKIIKDDDVPKIQQINGPLRYLCFKQPHLTLPLPPFSSLISSFLLTLIFIKNFFNRVTICSRLLMILIMFSFNSFDV